MAERLQRVVVATRPDIAAVVRTPTQDAIAAHFESVLPMIGLLKQEILATYEDAGRLTQEGIDLLCADPALDFVIDPVPGPRVVADAVDTVGPRVRQLKVHQCRSAAT